MSGSAPTLPPTISQADIDRLEAAILKAFGDTPEAQVTLAQDAPPVPVLPNTQDARIRAILSVAIPEELARVRDAPKGSGNDALNQASFNIGQMVGAGWITNNQAFDLLLSAAVPRRSRSEALATIGSGLSAGIKKPRDRLSDNPRDIPIAVIDAAMSMSNSSYPKKDLPKLTKSDPYASLPLGQTADWTRPQGILSEIVDWILATSRRPNRPLAVAAATAIISTVCGRHLYSATGTAMNVYIVCLADTAVGKDRPFSAIAEILHACGLSSLHTTGKAFSVSGYENLVVDTPCVCASVDEIGVNLLGKITNKYASSHEAQIKGALQELWSRSKGKSPFLTTRRAQSAPVEVHSPSLTIFGASTPEAFYKAFTEGNIEDGFLNRFLLAPNGPRGERALTDDIIPVPQHIKDALDGIIPIVVGNMGAALGVFSPTLKVDEVRLQWESPSVRDAANAFEDGVLKIIDSKIAHRELLGRVFEYAVRLAGIHAVSRAGRIAVVTLADMEWGAAWATASAKSMMDAAETLMSKSDYEAKMNAIRKVIMDVGVITRSGLMRAVRHLDARDCDNVINHFEEAGMVEKIEEKTTGRPVRKYRWVG